MRRHATILFTKFLFKQFRIFFSPPNHSINNGNQRHSQRSDSILRTRRQFWENGFRHQPVLHQFLQLHIKHTRRGFGEYLVQFARAQGTVAQFVQDAGLPLGINQAHGQPQGAIQIDGYLSFVHGSVTLECYDAKVRIIYRNEDIPNNFSVSE